VLIWRPGTSLFCRRSIAQVKIHLEIEYNLLLRALSRRLSNLLQLLSDEEIKDLADSADVCHFKAGDKVFTQREQGGEAMEMWVLLNGFVQASCKPGLKDVNPKPMLRAELDLLRVGSSLKEDSDLSMSSKSSKKLGRQQTETAMLKRRSSGFSIRTEDGSEDAQRTESVEDASNNALQVWNDSITPIPLFATRTFGATFGDETLISGEMRQYTLTAATDSKLCKVKSDYYMALFFTEEDVMEKMQAYSRAVIARCFSTSTQSLIHRIFPAEFMTRLERASVLRRVHAGGHIMKPPLKAHDKRTDKSTTKPVAASGNDDKNVHDQGNEQQQQPAQQRPDSETVRQLPNVFFLVSGRVEIVGYNEGNWHVYGGSETEGAIFGELKVLSGESHETYVGAVAASDCLVCELPNAMLDEMAAEAMENSDMFSRFKEFVKVNDHCDELAKPGMYVTWVSILERSGAFKQNKNFCCHLVASGRDDAGHIEEDEDEDEDQQSNENDEERGKEALPESIQAEVGKDPFPTFDIAVMALDASEMSMLRADGLLQKAQECDDWAIVYNDVVQAIDESYACYSEVLGKHSSALPVQGFDRWSLEAKLSLLDLMLLQVSSFIPVGPLQTERMARCKARHKILRSQKDFGRLMQHRHDRVDFASGTAVCNFMEKCQEQINSWEEDVPRHKAALVQRFGEKVGNLFYDEFYDWYGRKFAAWTSCHELHQQRAVMLHAITDLRRHAKTRELQDFEAHKLREMKIKCDGFMRVAEVIKLDLTSLNRAVAQTCFMGMPPPPAPGVEASPILSYVLHLQRIIETREDLRLAKTLAARQADAMMHRAFKECQIDASEPTRVFAVGESEFLRDNASREVAPILHGFLSNLGSWLFTTDAERWARQVRYQEKLNQTR